LDSDVFSNFLCLTCGTLYALIFCVCKETGKAVAAGDIWFRFKEGYLNAVRKTVRIQDLMS